MESASEMYRKSSLLTDYPADGRLRPSASSYLAGLFHRPNHAQVKLSPLLSYSKLSFSAILFIHFSFYQWVTLIG